MSIAEINKLSKIWTEHLTGRNNIDFDELICISKKNRRVRNSAIFVFYTDDSLRQRFEERTNYDQDARKMKYEFAKAIHRLKNENNKARYFAEFIDRHCFQDIEVELDSSKYDVSAEMAKFFNMMINNEELSKRDTEVKRQYRQFKTRNLNLTKLIH